MGHQIDVVVAARIGTRGANVRDAWDAETGFGGRGGEVAGPARPDEGRDGQHVLSVCDDGGAEANGRRGRRGEPWVGRWGPVIAGRAIVAGDEGAAAPAAPTLPPASSAAPGATAPSVVAAMPGCGADDRNAGSWGGCGGGRSGRGSDEGDVVGASGGGPKGTAANGREAGAAEGVEVANQEVELFLGGGAAWGPVEAAAVDVAPSGLALAGECGPGGRVAVDDDGDRLAAGEQCIAHQGDADGVVDLGAGHVGVGAIGVGPLGAEAELETVLRLKRNPVGAFEREGGRGLEQLRRGAGQVGMTGEPEVEGELGEGRDTEGEVERAELDVDVTEGDGFGGDVVELRRREIVDRSGAGRASGLVGHALLEDAKAPFLGPKCLLGRDEDEDAKVGGVSGLDVAAGRGTGALGAQGAHDHGVLRGVSREVANDGGAVGVVKGRGGDVRLGVLGRKGRLAASGRGKGGIEVREAPAGALVCVEAGGSQGRGGAVGVPCGDDVGTKRGVRGGGRLEGRREPGR